MSRIISSRFHRISLCDMYEPIFICFELSQIVSQQQPTTGKHCRCEGIADLEQSFAISHPAVALQPFDCNFPPMTPSAYTRQSAGINNVEITK